MQLETKPHILIIDDEADIIESIAHPLKNKFNVVTAANGQEGAFKFRNQHFNMIITDLNMPKKNGLAFIQELRRLEQKEKRSRCPIIAISGNLDMYLNVLKHNDLVFTLEKPFSIRDIIAKMKEAFAIAKSNQEGAEEKKTIAKGEILINEGEISDTLYMVLAGELEVIRRSDCGDEKVMGVVNAGELIGEMALVDKLPRSATVRGKDKLTEVIKIDSRKFLTTLDNSPRWMKNFILTMIKRLRDANDKALNNDGPSN